ncbi:MAG: protein tyrosine/serine phosphatase [Acidobacteria bacterium]|nr:protein tyrosine/serine phosphatase [Acidobacteriota bacterium]
MRMPHRRSPLLSLLFLALAACRTAAPLARLPTNFGVVEEGKIYRGAQPDGANLAQLKQRYGVRTILKLNPADLDAERADATRLGMQLIYVPLGAATLGRSRSCPQVERAYAALHDPSNWPLYVHCTHGRDRTGFLVGLFRERDERWDFARVREELARYGHTGIIRLLLPNITAALRSGHACG